MNGFEVDVLMTRDRVPVVVHDQTLMRLAGGQGAIHSMTWKELSRLDVGSHFHPRFAGERIPVLSEVLDAYGDMVLDIEIKGFTPWSEGLEDAVVEMVKERGMTDRVIISSFNPLILRRVMKLEPRIMTGSNYVVDAILILRRMWFSPFVKPFSKHPQPYQVDEAYMRRQQRRGIRVIPWGVDDPADMRRMFELDVDGLISDFPSLLRKEAEAT
jgi:glycerophosphoryl diester phosphodiesterase